MSRSNVSLGASVERAHTTTGESTRPRIARAVLRAALGAPLLLAGCLLWMQDDRPWLVNGTTEPLEVESTHADGHTLKIMLYPGTRVPLGATEDPIRAIAVKRRSEPAVVVTESEIRSCLEDRKRGCQGWNVSASGLEPIEKRGPSSVGPAEEPAAAQEPEAPPEMGDPAAEAPQPDDLDD